MHKKLLFIVTVIFTVFLGIQSFSEYGFSRTVRNDAYDSSQKYYYYLDEKMPLEPDGNKIAIKFKDGIDIGKIKALLDANSSIESTDQEQEIPDANIIICKINVNAQNDADIKTINDVSMLTEVEYASQVFKMPNGEFFPTDEIIAKYKDTVTDEEIDKFNIANGVEIVEKTPWGYYVLSVIDPKKVSALDVANYFQESDLVEYSHPNFFRRIKLTNTPNDTWFPYQWALKNTGTIFPQTTLGADIDAERAWDILTGSASVKIAIIDTGVDLNHEDLSSKIVPGYDFDEYDTNAQPLSWDPHGTECAGLAAAITNNGLGIAGVDWNAKIMPVRVGHHNSAHDTLFNTTEAKLANGINWAADNGARVISNSWGGMSPSVVVTNAIRHARNDKNAVVIFAAGNDDLSYLSYPQNLPEVIAVGASNLCDKRKVKLFDGCNAFDNTWGSSYGADLDILAPGAFLKTTDIMGSGGDVPENYVYFGGTSGSAPIVAGMASLLIAQDPSRTPDQVEYLLKANAEDKEASGKDNQAGFGRVNAYYALKNDINYLMPYYDQLSAGMSDWVMIANPGTTRLDASVTIGDGLSGLKEVRGIDSNKSATPTYNGTQAGPVKVASADGTTNALFSQRVLYNNNFNETMSVPESKLETDYYFTWYDNIVGSPPVFYTWIMVCNRGAQVANVEVTIGTPQDQQTNTYQIQPNQLLPIDYNNLRKGPVRVRSTNNQKLLVSERTVYQNGMNELMGIPYSALSTENYFTWYDTRADSGFSGDWLMITNMGSSSAHVEVYIQNMSVPVDTYDIAAGDKVTPMFANKFGPVKIKCTNGQNIITSQRTIYHGHFEEVPGVPAAALSQSMWFTWYDTLNMPCYLILNNISTTQSSTADIYLAGNKLTSAPLVVGPGSSETPYFQNMVDGPLEVRVLSGPNLLVSQRVIYADSFNELVGTVLSS